MGEIIFSVCIGACLVAIGLFMNRWLSVESRKNGRQQERHQE